MSVSIFIERIFNHIQNSSAFFPLLPKIAAPTLHTRIITHILNNTLITTHECVSALVSPQPHLYFCCEQL